MKSFASLAAKVTFGALSASILAIVVAPVSQALTLVDLELWLGIDASGSVSSSEFNLQKQGYVDAFKSSSVQDLIAKSTNGIAVGYGYWSGNSQQNVAVNWTQLTNAQESNDFANLIAATTRPFGSLTAIGSAINFGVNQINTNNFDGTNKTIDISGDGTNNSGASLGGAVANASSQGITINGLPIGSEFLKTYYEDNVVTPDGFVVAANSFADFDSAIQQKLAIEIDEGTTDAIPTPALLPGLVGVGIAALRKRGKSNTAEA